MFVDFVVELAGEQEEQRREGWMLHVDGSSTSSAGGAGILLQGPGDVEIEVAAKLDFPTKNNEEEYETFTIGLRMRLDVGVKQLDVYTDSQLVAMQKDGSYEIREWSMIQYLKKGDTRKKLWKSFRAQIASTKRGKTRLFLSNYCEGCHGICKKVWELAEVYNIDTFTYDPNGAHQDCLSIRSIGDRYPWTFPYDPCQEEIYNSGSGILSKWVEAEALAKIFEKENTIPRQEDYRMVQGVKGPTKFNSCGKSAGEWAIEVTNRILLQHLKTKLERAKGSWVEELLGVLWAYRTTPRTATGEIPFCLFYGSEAVIPAEIGEETARTAKYDPEENHQTRNFDLVTIEEIQDKAFAKILHYKSLMMKSYNSKVKPRNFHVGDLVLKKVEVSRHVEKLDPSREGPYKIIEVKKKGTYRLQDMEGKDLPRLWNIHNLRKFYA
ncbi:UNVERIFIED_CONTAM: hypothetical protein Slati_2711400 [Sesamum latifolium]|uniref:RNase H type-1 domain-containing protein n=1 Tax=Sesamum latifolium TaxID=2727402 RepID=A0AAW2VZB5_9LAMI